MPYTLSDHIDEIEQRKRPMGWRLFGWVFYGVVVIALAFSAITSSLIVTSIWHHFARDVELQNCKDAFNLQVSGTQNTFLTEGLGGLVSALAIEDPATKKATVPVALQTYNETLHDSQTTIQARKDWIARGRPLPCPISV